MKRLIIAFTLFCIPATFAQGIERTAAPLFSAAQEMQALRLVPTCPANTPVVVSGTRLICGQRAVAVGQVCPTNQMVRGFDANGIIICAAVATANPGPSTATGCGACPAGFPHLLSIGGRCSSNNDTFICGR